MYLIDLTFYLLPFSVGGSGDGGVEDGLLTIFPSFSAFFIRPHGSTWIMMGFLPLIVLNAISTSA